ncbi:MAG: PIN domain-containing protein [Theionarchaea archaeon]|nr:MAG: DNA-binding protein [Theionarchaea archaeon DG-70]MBU7011930.1 PIN domain-containing protein [Theionarchaea archaeon]
MFLVDTNIFLEVLLIQDKEEDCREFLDKNIGDLHITDFSLHSIGVITFRYKKEDLFRKFVGDVLPAIVLLSLPLEFYGGVIDVKKDLNLDFDDAYQYSVAGYYGLKIVTMDKDFEKIKDLEVLFL